MEVLVTDGVSDSDPIVVRPPSVGNITRITSSTSTQTKRPVCFDRHELNTILNVYGRRVAAGEWRDYALDMEKDRAVFSIFRRTSEMPIYRIEKNPKLARKQGAYCVISATGQILKRGTELRRVLSIFDKHLRLVEG
ncbi:MAG: DUF2794 domain-containing protein [Hyphomicrobiaceae bacterium]